jgi:hypothetical protein
VAGLHVHDRHTDAFYVLEGEVIFEIGAELETVTIGAGGFVAVPPGVAHSVRAGKGLAVVQLSPKIAGPDRQRRLQQAYAFGIASLLTAHHAQQLQRGKVVPVALQCLAVQPGRLVKLAPLMKSQGLRDQAV